MKTIYQAIWGLKVLDTLLGKTVRLYETEHRAQQDMDTLKAAAGMLGLEDRFQSEITPLLLIDEEETMKT